MGHDGRRWPPSLSTGPYRTVASSDTSSLADAPLKHRRKKVTPWHTTILHSLSYRVSLLLRWKHLDPIARWIKNVAQSADFLYKTVWISIRINRFLEDFLWQKCGARQFWWSSSKALYFRAPFGNKCQGRMRLFLNPVPANEWRFGRPPDRAPRWNPKMPNSYSYIFLMLSYHSLFIWPLIQKLFILREPTPPSINLFVLTDKYRRKMLLTLLTKISFLPSFVW